MPSLGPAEILVVLVIALLVFGPNKMPDIARQVGKGFREFKRVQQHLEERAARRRVRVRLAVVEHRPADPVPMLPAEGRHAGRGTAATPARRRPSPPAPADAGDLADARPRLRPRARCARPNLPDPPRALPQRRAIPTAG